MSVFLTRRRFVAGLGASLLAAPFVNLLSRPAHAAVAGGRAKRLLVFFTPNGSLHRFWRPTGGERDFGFASGSILEPLSAHRGSLILLDEMDFHNADNHAGGMAAMLTNGVGPETNGQSVDQFIARAIGTRSRFASIELGVQTSSWGGNVQTRMSYSGPGAFVTPDDDPRNAFNRMFGDLAGGAESIERLRKRRMSVLDVARDELADLHGRLGREERVKLEAHLDSLRSVETGVNTAPNSTCAAPVAPGAMQVYANDAYPQIARAQLDLAVQALACGLTNVASVQLSHTVGDRVFSWIDVADGHHTLSHADDSRTDKISEFVNTERWSAEQFAYLLDRLAALPDPEGGTLLDGTVVLWVKELGDPRLHTCKSVPWVMTGGGAFTPGRYLRLGGAHHSKVLVSLCQAFGLQNQSFGDPAAGTGALEVL